MFRAIWWRLRALFGLSARPPKAIPGWSCGPQCTRCHSERLSCEHHDAKGQPWDSRPNIGGPCAA